jgi:hypothetical protein
MLFAVRKWDCAQQITIRQVFHRLASIAPTIGVDIEEWSAYLRLRRRLKGLVGVRSQQVQSKLGD